MLTLLLQFPLACLYMWAVCAEFLIGYSDSIQLLSLLTEVLSLFFVWGYRLDGRGSVTGRCKVFLVSLPSIPTVGSSHPSSQWLPRAVYPEWWRYTSASPYVFMA
jgi:hypothetical protein